MKFQKRLSDERNSFYNSVFFNRIGETVFRKFRQIHQLKEMITVCLPTKTIGEDIDAEDRLMVDLFRGYNSLVQPVRNRSELPMIVKIGMQLVLLINVDEKEQVMHTNVWLTMKWDDFQLKWDPRDYANITQIRVAPEKVWLPDIVLFNK